MPALRHQRAFWMACAAAYLLVAALSASTLALPASPLDDRSQLHVLAQQPLSSSFAVDRFGHLRPLKGALLWAIARSPERLPLWRAALLGMFLASVALVQVLATRQSQSGWRGLAASLAWALNPTTLSTLCWLSSANLVIAGSGLLAFLLLAERAVAVSGRRRTALIAGFGAIASLLVALASHQLALASPLLWLLYHRSVGAPVDRRRLIALAVATAGCVAASAILHAVHAGALDYRFETHPRWQLVLGAPRYLFQQLAMWLWLPGRFGVLLSDRPADHLVASALAWIGLLAAGVLLWRWSRGEPRRQFALGWCALLLLPLMNFVPLGNTPIAIHYLYLPGVGLALLLSAAARHRVAAFALAGLVAAWLPAQRQVLAAWSDARVLYAETIRNYPDNVEARVNLVALYLDAGDYAAASRLLEASLQRAPSDRGLLANRFLLLAQLGRAEEALALQDAHPELQSPAELVRRGMLLVQLGRHDEAQAAFERAFLAATQPDDRFTAGYQLAIALVRTQRTERARSLIDRLLREFPDRPELLISKRLLANGR